MRLPGVEKREVISSDDAARRKETFDCFKYDDRTATDVERTEKAVDNMEGKRLQLFKPASGKGESLFRRLARLLRGERAPAEPRFDDDRIIGPEVVLWTSGFAAMWIPKRETLLGGDGHLSVPAPHGAEVDDPVLRRRARDELAEITGARWPARASVTVYDHLEHAQTRAEYRAKGRRLDWDTDGWFDPPETRYVAWSGTVDSLHVEVTGAIGEWAALLVAQPLTAAEALDGPLPRLRPVDALALVRRVAPAFAAHPWQEDADVPPANIFDVSLHANGARLRGGVRARGWGEETYFYGARLTWERAPGGE